MDLKAAISLKFDFFANDWLWHAPRSVEFKFGTAPNLKVVLVSKFDLNPSPPLFPIRGDRYEQLLPMQPPPPHFRVGTEITGRA